MQVLLQLFYHIGLLPDFFHLFDITHFIQVVLSVESVHLAEVAARCVVLRRVAQILLIAPARQILSINVSALRLELLPLFFLSGHLLAQFLGNEFILFDGLGSLFLLIPLIDPRIALITFDVWYFSVLSQLLLLSCALQHALRPSPCGQGLVRVPW